MVFTQGVVLVLVYLSGGVRAITNHNRDNEVPEKTFAIFNTGPNSHSHIEQTFYNDNKVTQKHSSPVQQESFYMQAFPTVYPETVGKNMNTPGTDQSKQGPWYPVQEPPRCRHAARSREISPVAIASMQMQGFLPDDTQLHPLTFNTVFQPSNNFIAPSSQTGFHAQPPVTDFQMQAKNMDERAKYLCYVLGLCGALTPSEGTINDGLMNVITLNKLEFAYARPRDKMEDINSGFLIEKIPAPIDVDVDYRNDGRHRIFVTIPRFQEGSPVTLGYLTGNSTIITPYPSWRWHRNPRQCDSGNLVSVYRIKIDECGRMWVLDTGKYGNTQVCPPQLLAFDMKTDRLLHRAILPLDMYEGRSIFVTPTIDVRDPQNGCMNTVVYMADCQAFTIVVYDLYSKEFWKINDKTMYPMPEFGTFSIQGDQFDLMDGILGMEIEPFVPGLDRKLFFHAMSSNIESWVYTSYLRNRTRFIEDPNSSPDVFRMFKTRRGSQSGPQAMDRNGVMYFGLMSETSVNCWNTKNSEYGKYIDTVQRDPVKLQFASGVKVITNKNNAEELWVLTSRFQKVATDTLDLNQPNFRISAGRVSDLVKNTRCSRAESAHSGGSSGGGYGFHRPQRGY